MIGQVFDKLRDARRRRDWDADRAAGRRGEDLAHRFLKRQGFIIVARNFRLASGAAEADLIAWEGQTLCVVEVKSRRSEEHGPPDRAIGEGKRRALLRVAQAYTRKTETAWEQVRIDVVTVILGSPPQIELHRGAISTTGGR